MASSLPSGQGKTIPEYSTAEVTKWLDGQAGSIGDLTNAGVIVVALIGFILFASGLWGYMAEEREGGGHTSGKGGISRPSIVMMVVGAGFGCVDVIFIFVVGFFR